MVQVSEVVTYLLPSWAYTIAQPEAAKNIVDLLIFCEQPFCALLPPSCRQLVSESGELIPAGHGFPNTALESRPTRAEKHACIVLVVHCINAIVVNIQPFISASISTT